MYYFISYRRKSHCGEFWSHANDAIDIHPFVWLAKMNNSIEKAVLISYQQITSDEYELFKQVVNNGKS